MQNEGDRLHSHSPPSNSTTSSRLLQTSTYGEPHHEAHITGIRCRALSRTAPAGRGASSWASPPPANAPPAKRTRTRPTLSTRPRSARPW